MNGKGKAYQELEREWYRRLKAAGFQDIEETSAPHRPLKRYTCFMRCDSAGSRRVTDGPGWPEGIYRDEERFFHHSRFQEICERLVEHGNHSLSPLECAEIWMRHIGGASCRQIASKMWINYVLVFRVKRALTNWMELIENE